MLLTKVKAETRIGSGRAVATLLRRGRRHEDQTPESPAPPRDRTRRIALIVAILCVVTLIGGGTAAFANDAFARAHLLPGTRIGGVYVGGNSL